MPLEQNLPLEILRPVFCEKCLQIKQMKHNPNIASKFCNDCVNGIGNASSNSKSYGIFLCRVCEENDHKLVSTKAHNRQTLLVGPGLRKKVIVRGDGKNFPQFLDNVKVKVSSRIYHNGRKIHSESAQYIHFTSGLSGKSIHIQLLGGKNLKVGDLDGSSDPFVSFSYCGKVISTTRVRPRTLNPRWNNETFVVPMEDHVYPSQINPSSSSSSERDKDLVRLEVFDHDYVSQNDFLGHIELSRDKLSALAVITAGQAIDVPLTMKEHRGVVGLKIGFDEEQGGLLSLQVCGAEGLDSVNPKDLSNPYAKIWMTTTTTNQTEKEVLIGTTTTDTHTVNPVWGDIFRILEVSQFLTLETTKYPLPPPPSESAALVPNNNLLSSFSFDEMDLLISSASSKPFIRIEIWSYRNYHSDVLLGETVFPFEMIRKMVPSLPSSVRNQSQSGGSEVRKRRVATIGISFSRKSTPSVFWSDSYPFVVSKEKDKQQQLGGEEKNNNVDLGSLIIRLLPSNRGQVIVGLDEGIRQMTLGETAQIKCRYDYAYNNYSMSGSIPPRSNIIFRVELLDINGRGKWDMPIRQLIRLKRVVLLLCQLCYSFCCKAKKTEVDNDVSNHSSSKKRKAGKESFSGKFLQIIGLRPVSNEESDSEGSDGDNNNLMDNVDDKEYDQLMEEGSLRDESSLESHRIKPDPRIKKFLNQSVKTGNKLLWNYNPKPKPKKGRGESRLVEVKNDDEEEGDGEESVESVSDSLEDDENNNSETNEREELVN